MEDSWNEYNYMKRESKRVLESIKRIERNSQTFMVYSTDLWLGTCGGGGSGCCVVGIPGGGCTPGWAGLQQSTWLARSLLRTCHGDSSL